MNVLDGPPARAYLEDRPEEPPFQRFWWNPSSSSTSRRLTREEVDRIGRQVAQVVVPNIEKIYSVGSVREGTRQINWAAQSALQSLGYECFTEIPFTHKLIDGHARADIIAFSPNSPTVYIEIDSTPATLTIEQNARKLHAAWMMGAAPIWIGWHNFDPFTIGTEFPLTKLKALDSSIGLMKEASYKRAATKSLNELTRIVDTILAMSPVEGRCNLPTKTSTLCKREPGRCPHNPVRESLGQLYPDQVLEQAMGIVEKLTMHYQNQQVAPLIDDGDEPPVIYVPEEEFPSPFDY